MNRSQLLRESWRGWMNQSQPNTGPWWWQWVWTLLFSALVALGFAILGFIVSGGAAAETGAPRWAKFYLG